MADELKKFRAKYPGYDDMDDATLAQKLASKYPEYGDLAGKVKETQITAPEYQSSTPKWAEENPNLYGMVGAGKALAKTGIEAAGTTGGAAVGAMTPVPGGTLAGAGAGYAASKRVGEKVFGDEVDMSAGSIATDFALGAAFQSVGGLVKKIPGIGKILSPSKVDIGKEATTAGKMSQTMMEKTLKIPPSGKIGYQQVNRETVINAMLEEKIPVTKGGLDRVKGMLQSLGNDMDDVILQNPDTPIAIDSVLKPVQDFQSWVGQTVRGSKYARQVQGEINAFKNQYGDVITVQQAQEIKKRTGVMLRKSYGELKPVIQESQKQIVRGLKDRIAEEVPEIAGINLKYSELKQVELALERAVNRTGNWDWFSLSAGVTGMMVGGTTGKLTKAAEAVALFRVLKSPAVQSRLAIALKNSGAGGKSNMMANAITVSAYKKAKDMLGNQE